MDNSSHNYDIPSSFVSRGFRRANEIRSSDSNENDFIRNLAENCFSKTFYLKSNGEYWKLPENKAKDFSGNERWQVSELCSLKMKLNISKNKLNEYALADWHKHTNSMNPAGLVLQCIRFCNIELLTQAWCKMYEILNVFPILNGNLEGKLNTVHLCEAPGAFVTALNHFLKSKHPNIEWKWIANTLNPYYEGNSLEEMINDDRFIFKTLNNWWFGEDYTGNIKVKKNVDSLERFVGRIGPIHLITADGSVDCYKNPAEQESHVLPLHYAEATAALKTLSKGGSFVLKIFTVFECETVCLLYLLCSVFKSVALHKPVVSKEGNSEAYVVCTEYSGRDSCSHVISNIDSFDVVIFHKEDLPETFITKVVECSTFFTTLQIEVLEKNINSYKSKMSHKRKMQLKRVRNTVAELFKQRFSISSLDPTSFILQNQSFEEENFNRVPKNEKGTFQERQEFLKLEKKPRLLRYMKTLEDFKVAWGWERIKWFHLLPEKSNYYNPIVGEPISQIKSSKFCRGNLITIINELESYGGLKLLDPTHINSSLVEYIPGFPSNYSVCYLPNEYLTSSFYKYQKESLQTVIRELKNISLHDNFILIGLPLLTQFNVGIAYLIGLAFGKVGVVTPDNVGYVMIFEDLISNSIVKNLEEILDEYLLHDLAVISIFPLTLLCDGDWYRCITTLNHLVLKKIALTNLVHHIYCT